MKFEKRIYCIEGHWDYGKRQVEPSVEPVLQMLQKYGSWNYVRRDCATREELQFWITHEWTRCKPGSILYIASHGSAGSISLTHKNDVDIDTLADWLSGCKGACTNKWVHFGGCRTFASKEGRDAIRAFIGRTEASCVTGYSKTTGWMDLEKRPAVALELMLFASTVGVKFEDGRTVKGPMRRIESRFKVNSIFKDCGFRVFTKWDEEQDH